MWWQAFLKSCRWFMLATGAVVGTSAFIISDNTGSTKPIILGVFAYGLIYIMSYFWTEFRGRLMLTGILVFFFATLIQPYMPSILYVLFGYHLGTVNTYIFWWQLQALFGFPVMILAFRFWGD